MISKEKEQELTAVLEQFYKEVEIKAKETGHPEFAEQFKRSYGDTLKRTMAENPDGTVHVITGDIPAMWLRDSTAQVRPYLYLAARSTKLQELIGGVVQRQFFYLLMDPFAIPFNWPGFCGRIQDIQHIWMKISGKVSKRFWKFFIGNKIMKNGQNTGL